MRGYNRAVGKIAATAFLGGLAEALFLIVVTRVAFAIANGHDRIDVLSRWQLSVESTLLFGVSLITVRIILAAYASWQAANVATAVVTDIRIRIGRAFL